MKLIFIIISLFIAGCGSSQSDNSQVTISVSTFNVHKSTSPESIESFYKSNKFNANISVVGFQEVMEGYIPAGELFEFSIDMYEFTSIQSNVIGDAYLIHADAEGVNEKRSYQSAYRLDIDGKKVLFVSVHFQYKNRKATYEQTKELVAEIGNIDYDELVVMGDFNLAKDGCRITIGCSNNGEEGVYFKLAKLELESIGLSIIGDTSKPCWSDGSCTFQSHNPATTLDYILISQGLKVERYKVVTPIVDGVYISDHNMITAVISMR